METIYPYLLKASGLIALFYNLITLFVDSVSQNGVSGLLDELINFLNTLWNGAN